ncbi:hypothetical protein H5410_036051 [Solanum commersonii]|uniref:Uncharacterized protein n=1 Tax=Solanum commersonii TaxID=4109 RepID=A0A9J5Y2G0_SOLCO|nr:hypothetical protein H5410_036051 [Solanum commersonii]
MCRKEAGGVTRMFFRLDTASWAPCFAMASVTLLACRKLCRIVRLPTSSTVTCKWGVPANKNCLIGDIITRMLRGKDASRSTIYDCLRIQEREAFVVRGHVWDPSKFPHVYAATISWVPHYVRRAEFAPEKNISPDKGSIFGRRKETIFIEKDAGPEGLVLGENPPSRPARRAIILSLALESFKYVINNELEIPRSRAMIEDGET